MLMLWVALKESLSCGALSLQAACAAAGGFTHSQALVFAAIPVRRRAAGGRRWCSCSRIWYVFARCWRRRGECVFLAGVYVVHATCTVTRTAEDWK